MHFSFSFSIFKRTWKFISNHFAWVEICPTVLIHRLFFSVSLFSFFLTQKQHFSWGTFFLTFFVSLISITPKPREAPGSLKTPPRHSQGHFKHFISHFKVLFAHLEIIRFKKNWSVLNSICSRVQCYVSISIWSWKNASV